MELSLPGWIGGLAGTVIAVVLYVPGIRAIERHWRAQHSPASADQRAEFEARLSLLRRVILAVDIAVLATLGYWIGNALAGAGAPRFH